MVGQMKMKSASSKLNWQPKTGWGVPLAWVTLPLTGLGAAGAVDRRRLRRRGLPGHRSREKDQSATEHGGERRTSHRRLLHGSPYDIERVEDRSPSSPDCLIL